MNGTTEMRALTVEEIDAVAGGGAVISGPTLNVEINPQMNAGISAAFAIGGNAISTLIQKNLHFSIVG